jgi:hypothetical protein
MAAVALAGSGDLLPRSGQTFPENVFEPYNIYLTCQTNDDIPYIVRYAGENRMEGIDSAVKEKILSHNAKALYGL